MKVELNKLDQLKKNHDYFILSTVYDPKSNGAGIKLLDSETKQVVYITDPYKHEPYCYTIEPIEKISPIEFPEGVKKRIEKEKKRDILNDDEIVMTKIVTHTPNDVPKVRDTLGNISIKSDLNGETWESRIKYHRNWIYDVRIVPGRKYWWDSDKNKFTPSLTLKSGLKIPKTVINHLSIYQGLLDEFRDDFTQEIPDIPVVACDIETEYIEGQIPQASDPKFKIICVCFADNENNLIALLLERKGLKKGNKSVNFPLKINIERFSTEEGLIRRTFEILKKYPIIVSFNGDNFDFPYLHERGKLLKVYSSPIDWNRKNSECNFQTAIHIDLYRFYHNVAIKTYAFGNRYQEENLDAIAQGLLGTGKISFSQGIANLSEWDLIHYCAQDAKITLDLLLFDNRTPLTLIFILARITRTPIDDLIRSSVSTWVKSLFYSEHRRRGYFIPNQKDIQNKKGILTSSQAIIKGKKYKGAKVIDPIPGIHFKVAVLDFASLYPSIISIFNLSYETILCNHKECKNNKVPQTEYWVCIKNRGIIADIIGFIKDLRVQWLKPESKKDSPQKDFYRILERSLKVLINASYGVLGSDRFQFYCLPVADSTTAYGRDSIERTIQKAQSLGLKVLYGDTDSVFLLNPSEKQIDEIIKWSFNELGVGLEMEKFYRYVVLSERKKNYLGMYPDSSVEVKGLLGKKRNTPPFLQDNFKKVLDIISRVYSIEEFNKAKKEVISLVRSIYQNLEKGNYSGEELAITMQITQPLYKYKVKSQHVKAAYQLEKMYQKKYGTQKGENNKIAYVKAGQLIRFVKTNNLDGVVPLELFDSKVGVDVKAYKSMVESTFGQLFDALDIDFNEIASGQVNLMEFFN